MVSLPQDRPTELVRHVRSARSDQFSQISSGQSDQLIQINQIRSGHSVIGAYADQISQIISYQLALPDQISQTRSDQIIGLGPRAILSHVLSILYCLKYIVLHVLYCIVLYCIVVYCISFEGPGIRTVSRVYFVWGVGGCLLDV